MAKSCADGWEKSIYNITSFCFLCCHMHIPASLSELNASKNNFIKDIRWKRQPKLFQNCSLQLSCVYSVQKSRDWVELSFESKRRRKETCTILFALFRHIFRFFSPSLKFILARGRFVAARGGKAPGNPAEKRGERGGSFSLLLFGREREEKEICILRKRETGFRRRFRLLRRWIFPRNKRGIRRRRESKYLEEQACSHGDATVKP